MTREHARDSGRFTYAGGFERLCVCGRPFGDHAAAAPHPIVAGGCDAFRPARTGARSSPPPRDPATMTAREINAELDRLQTAAVPVVDEMIAAGRGYETHEETHAKARAALAGGPADPLAVRYEKIADRRAALRLEIAARYGPGAPGRLPTRGFPPRRPRERAAGGQ